VACARVLIRRRDGSTVWLPGCGGIGDATSVNGNLVYYLPRHDKRTMVETVDFRSGGGRAEVEGKQPRAPKCVVTDLCVVHFQPEGPTVESVHPGVTADEVSAATSFDLVGLDRASTTEPPNASERKALALVDPNCLRNLEFTGGAQRRALLHIAAEQAHQTWRMGKGDHGG
jgi:glutaconate CoA-transferase subunit B